MYLFIYPSISVYLLNHPTICLYIFLSVFLFIFIIYIFFNWCIPAIEPHTNTQVNVVLAQANFLEKNEGISSKNTHDNAQYCGVKIEKSSEDFFNIICFIRD